MKSCPGNGSGLIQVLTRCQPAWLLLWLISCRQFSHARLRVFGLNDNPRFYVSTSKSIIKALINMHSFEIQLSPIG
ncbi:hypothetical protein FJC07_07765 [Escherichia coli]|nr:hypothetical protein [Escherichia coli]EGO3552433.1 hypothetical protein [Escherichia coli]NJW17918.1 hypothetical protein [Escherichia coli]HAK9711596.1 hypothetical protein [Escherichia coli]